MASVLQLQPSDHEPQNEVVWQSSNVAPFRFEKRFGFPNGRAVWAIGGPHTLGRPLWTKHREPHYGELNTAWARQRYSGDPAADPFFNAFINCENEQDMSAALNAAYPRVQSSNYDRTLRYLYSTTIDILAVEDYAWDVRFCDTGPRGKMNPHWGTEYDGITGAGLYDGNIRSSRIWIGDHESIRFDDGALDVKAVEQRPEKIQQKVTVLADVQLPMTVLPTTHSPCIGDIPMALIRCMSTWQPTLRCIHLNSSCNYLRHPRYDDASWTEAQRYRHVAGTSCYGHIQVARDAMWLHSVGADNGRDEIRRTR